MDLSIVELIVEYFGLPLISLFVSLRVLLLLICLLFFVIYSKPKQAFSRNSKTANERVLESQLKDKMSSTCPSSLLTDYPRMKKDANRNRSCHSTGCIISYPSSSPRSVGNEEELFFGRATDESSLELDKLQIGSPGKNLGRVRSMSPRTLRSTSPVILRSEALMSRDSGPLWKDYPMVQKAVPSSCSYCSMPLSSYPNSGYGSPSGNYRSSSVATIFGGPKPIISPPKLDVGFTMRTVSRYDMLVSVPPGYTCYPNQNRHNWSLPLDNVMSPYLSSPLSRSSSQSSGFISQNGFHTPPPSAVNYSNINSDDYSRYPDTLSVYSDSQLRGEKSKTTSFYSEDLASFSSLNNNESNVSEENDARDSVWRPSSFASNLVRSISAAGSNTNGNTCSRFARKETESDYYMKRLSDVRSVNSSLFSEDEDEDDVSFLSAVTSLTKRTNAESSHQSSLLTNRLRRSKSKIRTGPFMRNLRSTEEYSNEEGNHSTVHTCDRMEPEKRCTNLRSFARQMFWNLSIFLNIIIMFWLFLGSPYDPQESHWIHQTIHNTTDIVVSSGSVLWGNVHRFIFDILSAQVVGSVSPTNLVVDQNEL